MELASPCVSVLCSSMRKWGSHWSNVTFKKTSSILSTSEELETNHQVFSAAAFHIHTQCGVKFTANIVILNGIHAANLVWGWKVSQCRFHIKLFTRTKCWPAESYLVWKWLLWAVLHTLQCYWEWVFTRFISVNFILSNNFFNGFSFSLTFSEL